MDVSPEPKAKSVAAATTPSIAGMYNYYLGGSNNSAVDRDAAKEVQKAMPDASNLAKENRSYLRRCIGYMYGCGIRQFIDIGSGHPTDGNTHEIVHSVAPRAKVVYVDIDPTVVEYWKSQLSAASGTTTTICGDIRKTQEVLGNSELARYINFKEPVGILMMCVACFFTEADITTVMSTIRSTICDGSYVAVTHDTLDGHKHDRDKIARVQKIYSSTSIPIFFRSREEVVRIFHDLNLVEPGVVFLDEWRVETDLPAPKAVRWLYGGVARKDSTLASSSTLPIHFDPMQLRKGITNSAIFTSSTLLAVIWWCVSILESFVDGKITPFQQFKDMMLSRDGKQAWHPLADS